MTNFEMLKQTSIEEFREAIERVNKISIDEIAKTISDNYNKKCCENCICAESCKKTDCEAGIKHWLESEAEE